MAVTIYTIEAYVGRPVDWKNDEVTLKDDGDGNGAYIDVWDVSGKTKPTTVQLATYDAAEQAEYDAQEYARDRQAEYPSINDLIVALWENVVEDRTESATALETLRQAVKAKYPK